METTCRVLITNKDRDKNSQTKIWMVCGILGNHSVREMPLNTAKATIGNETGLFKCIKN